jgi:16S rRNA (guanine527-N7)-methyltransferase
MRNGVYRALPIVTMTPMRPEALSSVAGIEVSRETYRRLTLHVDRLLQWQPRINLVSPTTIDDVWRRHVADSLQILALGEGRRRWLDLGSGGGFPGLVIAIALAETPGAAVTLVESNGKKAAFLREIIRITQAPAVVLDDRLETVLATHGAAIGPVDIVTARALAPLPDLIAWTRPLLKTGAWGLFMKGKDAKGEAVAAAADDLAMTFHPSRTEPQAAIVKVVDPSAAGGADHAHGEAVRA